MGTIGSGIFVLPYLFYHSNFVFASFFLIILGIITIVLNRFYANIVDGTVGDHQLAGYANLYLGKRFKSLATINLLLLSFGAITAYQKLFHSFLVLLFPGIIPSATFIIYFAILITVYRLYFLPAHKLDFIIPLFMILIPVFIFIYSLNSSFLIPNSSFLISPSFLFFGATVYALSGFTIIPEIQQILLANGHNSHTLQKAVTWGIILVVICYLLFTYGVINLSGSAVTMDTVTGLSLNYPLLSKVISLFGAIVVVRASFGFLVVLRELFFQDLFIGKKLANLLPLTFPVLSLLLGSMSLVSIISITGNLTVFVSALLICLIKIRLSNTFWTQFWVILIIVILSLGLLINT